MSTTKQERKFIRTRSDRAVPIDKRDRLPRDYVASKGRDLQDALDEWSEDYADNHDIFI